METDLTNGLVVSTSTNTLANEGLLHSAVNWSMAIDSLTREVIIPNVNTLQQSNPDNVIHMGIVLKHFSSNAK